MILVLSVAIALLFGAGAYLLVSRDLIRVVAGSFLFSNAAFLYVFSAGLTRGRAPLAPFGGTQVSDPLVQALVLTAVVISFGVTALALALAARLHATHGTSDLEHIAQAEAEEETRTESDE